MKVWGKGAFENAAAMDWLGGLASGLMLADLGEVLRAPESTEVARAAACLVAAALSVPVGALPLTAHRWLGRQDLSRAESLRELAEEVARQVGDEELAAGLAGIEAES